MPAAGLLLGNAGISNGAAAGVSVGLASVSFGASVAVAWAEAAVEGAGGTAPTGSGAEEYH
jgi:hypothetical protein